uniref:Uncharacterized protein orf464 n=1 Tax=Bigelowiella natans TaxID=227086 RepID=E9NZW5_BIGNA|nr:hypothetical protein [Bigelowiella natans]
MSVRYKLWQLWDSLKERWYNYFARTFAPLIRAFLRLPLEVYIKVLLSVIKWLTIFTLVLWLLWCAYVAWPLLLRTYAEFSTEGITAARFFPWLFKELMHDRYLFWVIPTVLFSPYISHRIVWEVCLWLSEDGGDEPGFRPYDRTNAERFMEMPYEDVSIFLLFWAQQQVYLAFLYDRIIKPMFLESQAPNFTGAYQTWGSWTDYGRYFAIFDWWWRLDQTLTKFAKVQQGVRTAGTFYSYEPFWIHGSAWVVPARSYANSSLSRHWLPDEYWLTLYCRRALFARQISPQGGCFLKPYELQDLEWGNEIYTPSSIIRSWCPLWGFQIQNALYFGYVAKRFSIPSVLEGHSYFRAVCLSKGIDINYVEWLPDLFIKKSVIDSNSRLHLWYFHSKDTLARHQYNLDHDIFTLAWLWSKPCRIHQVYHYMPDYYRYFLYRDVFNGATVLSPARLTQDSYGDALFLCGG